MAARRCCHPVGSGGRQLDQVLAEVSPLVEAATAADGRRPAHRRRADRPVRRTSSHGQRSRTARRPPGHRHLQQTRCQGQVAGLDHAGRAGRRTSGNPVDGGHHRPWRSGRPQISVLGPVGAERAAAGARRPRRAVRRRAARAAGVGNEDIRRLRRRAAGRHDVPDCDPAGPECVGPAAISPARTPTPRTSGSGDGGPPWTR